MEYVFWIILTILILVLAKINNNFIDFKKIEDNDEYSILEKEGVKYIVLKDVPEEEFKRTLWIYNQFVKKENE